MEEVQNTSVETQENVVSSADNYIEAINDLKANSVPKEDYERLMQENKQLLDSLVKGDFRSQQEEPPVDIEAVKDNLFNKQLSNLDYMKNALTLREETIKKGGKDPFLPNGSSYIASESDLASVERVVSVLKECIEMSEGSEELFNSYLSSKLVDPRVKGR